MSKSVTGVSHLTMIAVFSSDPPCKRDSADEQFKMLLETYSNPLLGPILMFHSASISLFTTFNNLLQIDDATIPILLNAMNSLVEKT